MKKNTLLFVITLLALQMSFSQEVYKKVSISNTNPSVIHILDIEGIDLTCGAVFKNNSLEIELNEHQLIKLDENDISYNILIENMEQFYSQRAIANLPQASLELQQMKQEQQTMLRSYSVDEILNNVGQHDGCDEIDWNIPNNWSINDAINYPSESNHFGGCLTYDMILDELDAMKTQYPNLISTRANASPSNQKTYENRTVWMVRISDNPEIDEPGEPETLYQSLIHSREAATVMNQLFFMWYLLENYDSDPAIRNLVNNQALYFIPVFNPDGFVHNQNASPNGGGGQRKNRNSSASGSCSTYLEGIDLNRNSAYYWGNGGSSTNSCSDTYMGTGPFSENETQIMRDFFLEHDFKLALNHHSYKNAALHAYAGIDQANARADEYSKYNYDMTYYNRFAHGPSTYISYLNSGNMNDWMQGGPAGTSANGTPSGTGSGKNTLSWTPENGLSSQGIGGTYGGFWPQPSQYVHIAKNAMRMNFMAAYFSGKYAKLHDFNQSNIANLSGDLKFAVENLGQTASNFTVTVTPVSSNIQSVGAPVVLSGMTVLQQNDVAINYTLSPSIQTNDKIEFKVVLTNDYASDNVLYEANIVKHYTPTVLFNGDALSNWSQTTGTWYSTSNAYSGTAITSTNGGSYSNSSTKRIQMNGSVDLSGLPSSVIQFYAKWDLERSFDYVQLEGSTDGTNWTPLCGKLTKPGAPDANNTYSGKSSTNNDFQPDGEPLYDGDTQGRWNMEEYVIDASNNSFLFEENTVYLRFEFRTDGSNRQDRYANMNFEGFTFDEFKIIGIQIPCETTVPTGLMATSITANSATVSWDNVPSATYTLRYRVAGTSTWTEVTNLSSPDNDLINLSPETIYEYQVRTHCSSSFSSYSSSEQFATTAVNYCDAEGDDIGEEYISAVTINGTTSNTESSTSSGYSDLTSTVFTLDLNSTGNTISVSKYWTGDLYNEAVSVWIDFNQNGTFENSEKIFESGASQNNPVSSTFNVPNIPTASTGTTRMRVIMKYFGGTGNTADDPCETFNYGEVEDYTVDIIDSTLNTSTFSESDISVYPNPFNNTIQVKLNNINTSVGINVYDISGRSVLSLENQSPINNEILVTNLSSLSSGTYFIKVTENTTQSHIIKRIIKK
ncbi:M14 family zinc carboxypeptidase [Corallibacter sp.]|uniref:M14 family zinc carboxypeptidase n=1 Tax=Corallibacter sp. TaxID=2038084 RepID=UPI003AB3A772